MTEPSPRRICLVDDHADFRDSSVWWLESLGYDVLAFDAPQALLDAAAAQDLSDTCLLLDVRMPQMSGLELLDAVRASGLAAPVIFMTGHGDVPLAVEAMRKGAITFLEKPFREAALEGALARAFAAVATPASARLATVATDREPTVPAADPARHAEYVARQAKLTEREREVMGLLVHGDVNKVVAQKLGISPKTVELHRARVMAKMGARRVAHLVRMSMTREIGPE